MRNIIMAFPDGPTNDKIVDILHTGGLDIVGQATSQTQVLQMAARLVGGGIIIGPATLSGYPTALLTDLLSEDFDLLILLNGDQVWDYSRHGVFALRTPIRPAELLDSIRMLLETRQMASSVRPYVSRSRPGGETAEDAEATAAAPKHVKVRSEDEKRKIERAKQFLMMRNNMSEEQAHRFLQKRSMDTGNSLVLIATQILDI